MTIEENLIWDIAWKYHRTTGIDINDLFSEGKLGYVKAHIQFEENRKAKFTTYAYKAIENHLIKYVKDQMLWNKNTVIDTEYIDKILSEDLSTKFLEKLEGALSTDARKIINIILDTQEAQCTRQQLRKFLNSQGISYNIIQKCFVEIKNMFKNRP